MARLPSVSAATLRRLLALARDLLQAPDPTSVLALAGPAIQELLMADGALLLVALGGQEYITEFDQSGFMQPARKETALCQYARRAMDSQTPILLPDVATDSNVRGLSVDGTASLLAFPFPRSSRLAFWPSSGVGKGTKINSLNRFLPYGISANSREPPWGTLASGRFLRGESWPEPRKLQRRSDNTQRNFSGATW